MLNETLTNNKQFFSQLNKLLSFCLDKKIIPNEAACHQDYQNIGQSFCYLEKSQFGKFKYEQLPNATYEEALKTASLLSNVTYGSLTLQYLVSELVEQLIYGADTLK